MLKQSGVWTALTFPHLLPLYSINHSNSIHITPSFIFPLKLEAESASAGVQCSARRRALYDETYDDDEEYEQNEEIGMLETYTQYVKDEVLLVKAMVDGEEAEVLVFKVYCSTWIYLIK